MAETLTQQASEPRGHVADVTSLANEVLRLGTTREAISESYRIGFSSLEVRLGEGTAKVLVMQRKDTKGHSDDVVHIVMEGVSDDRTPTHCSATFGLDGSFAGATIPESLRATIPYGTRDEQFQAARRLCLEPVREALVFPAR